MIEILQKALIDVGVDEVHEVAGTLNVKQGKGPLARAVNIDPAPAIGWLEAQSESGSILVGNAASWANGVLTVLLEPKHSKARDWTFVESAGSILPTIERGGFALGVADANGGDPAWTQEIAGGLVRAWVLRLGRGLRPLTVGQVADWGVTEDRITAAGRSLLFHKTRQHEFKPTDTNDVLTLSARDGHDAARLWIVEDAFFTEADRNWRFAIPHPDAVLAVRTPDHLDALRSATHVHYGHAMYPLSRELWKFGPGGPEPVGA